MQRHAKMFYFLLVGCLVIFVFAFATAHAAQTYRTLHAFFNDIKIYVNDDPVVAKDLDGNVAEPFIINGVTYLPLRAVSEALGHEVSWDQSTYSVHISKKPGINEVPGEQIKEIRVKTAQEFVDAIGPNTKIILEPGRYDLSDLESSSPYVYSRDISELSDLNLGVQLFINNVNNLTIEGAGTAQTELVTRYAYANVLNFISCNNITIRGIKAGHDVEKGDCLGGVFSFSGLDGVKIIDSYLYGCGTYGVTLEYSQNFSFINSTIDECTYGLLIVNKSSNVAFQQSNFINSNGFDMITIMNSGQVSFTDCVISGNDNSDGYYEPHGSYGLISTLANHDKVLFKDCLFDKNRTGWFGDIDDLTFDNCTFTDNITMRQGGGLEKLQDLN
jgi:hypothetical protein